MKKLLLIATSLLILVPSAFSQAGPCPCDNFDPPRGAQILYPPSPEIAHRRTAAVPDTADKQATSPYALPPASDNRVRKTAMVSMTIYDGYVQHEASVQRKAPVQLDAPARYAPAPVTMTAGKLLKGYSTGDPLID